MVRFILTLVLASIAGCGVYSHDLAAGNAAQTVTPQESDPLASAECQLARRELEVVLSAVKENRNEKTPKLDLARKRMALACLGQAKSPARRTRTSPPVIVVPPTLPAAPPLPVIAAPQPPVTIPRPSVITSCDAGGCWDSEGVRLNRSGPNLIGPRGPCTAQGDLFICP